MSLTNLDTTFEENPLSVGSKLYDRLCALSKFELHYYFDGSYGATEIVRTILQDLSSHRPLHNWDETPVNDVVKNLARFASDGLNRFGLNTGTHALNCSVLNEVYTINGVTNRSYAPSDQINVMGYFRAARVNLCITSMFH